MIDNEIELTIRELYELLNPEIVRKIESHVLSLQRHIEDLTKSRDDWKMKYKRLKGVKK